MQRQRFDLVVRWELPHRIDGALKAHEHRGRAGADLRPDLKTASVEPIGEIPHADAHIRADEEGHGPSSHARETFDPALLFWVLQAIRDDLNGAVAALREGVTDGHHLCGIGMAAGHQIAVLIQMAIEAGS